MKLFLSLALFAAFLLFPAACADGVRDGLSLAAGQALPALFPFFLASGLLVRSGLAQTLTRPAARPLAQLYHLPPSAATAVILGLTGGYPVGTATTVDLLRQGALSRDTAARVNSFCNCASPGFCIGLAGLGIFGSARTGAVLYGIHILTALLTGLLVARPAQFTAEDAAPHTSGVTPCQSFSAIFCAAVQQAAATALTVTAFLTVFCVFLHLVQPVLSHLPYSNALSGMLELTSGLDALRALPFPDGVKLTLVSFLLGFGGLAVQFQARALAEPAGLPMDGFAASKLLHGAMAAAFTALLTRISPTALPAFAPVDNALQQRHYPAFFLILLFMLFTIWSGKKAKNKI
ncbi:hypothetical protein ACTQ34_07490 [Agathobaculum sp. LCP25S3_E8]|uniref:hypothetical protein n=1 Tax=Agathobaculum sp. LCP25S3_E8 TaxID=3438735 RepID=UPI003F93D978